MEYAINSFKLKILILSLCVGLLGVVINLTLVGEMHKPAGQMLEEKFGLYALFHLRGAISAPNDVVVVAVDQPSSTQFNLSVRPNLWPRKLHAQLIDTLSQAGASAIVFDLTFDTPSKDLNNDKMLAEAIKKAGNVVIVERLDFEEAVLSTDQLGFNIIKESAAPLVPIIADAALAHAPFVLPKSTNVNAFWAFRESAGDAPTLPVFALQIFTLSVYNDFMRRLEVINPEYIAQFSLDQGDLDIENLIFKLRNLFITEPTIKKQMLIQLTHDTGISMHDRRMIEALLRLYSGDEAYYLNFYGPPRSVKTIPYYQVDQSLESVFKNKVVFVGFSAVNHAGQDRVRDDYHTVFTNPDGLTISGVEIAATAFANLLDDQSIKPFPFIGSLMLLFVFGIGIGIVFSVTSNRNAIIFGSLLIFVYGAYVYYQFQELNVWLPIIVPFFLQVPLALFGAVLLKYYQARYERKQLKKIFGCFLPDKVVNSMLHSAGPIAANNKLVYGACLATDAEMYTSLAEKMAPRELGLLMNNYYAQLFDPVKQHNGIVSDVVGDAMLAIWAEPFPSATLRKQACLASLDIMAAVERFNQNEDQPRLPTRIGLHFGEMLLGNVGAGHHFEYRAVGDMVNTTNRIQGANKYLGTRLLLSSEVIAGLDDFLIRPLGDFLLVGKSTSVNLAELITLKQTATIEQLRLCEDFASALQAYHSQQWQEAGDMFLKILDEFHEDGPTQFFLAYCKKYQINQPGSSWSSIVQMGGK